MRQKQSPAASIVLRLVQKALNAGTFKLNDFHDRPAIVYRDWSMVWCAKYSAPTKPLVDIADVSTF